MASDPTDLCDVVKEIAAALIDSDFTRYRSADGDCYYYVIRERDHAVEINSGRAFGHMLVFSPVEQETFWDWYIRAALAEEPSDRLAVVRKRFAQAGGDPKQFDEAMTTCGAAMSVDELRAALDPWIARFIENVQFDALTALMQGARIERLRRGHVFLSEADRPELRQALEARFLKELAERYPKVVKRAATFDWLAFSDPQLREASRCYLYGFFRAAVLIAVAAVETRLRNVCAANRWTSYDELADLAFGKAGVCGVDETRSSALKDLFSLRHEIAHAGAEPSAHDAEKALLLVRNTIDTLTSAASGSNQSFNS